VTNRAYYSDQIDAFLSRSVEEIVGALAIRSRGIEALQRDAWVEQVLILQNVLSPFEGRGKVYFEYVVPRLGKRIDVVLVLDHVVFVIEFKVGEATFPQHARDQVVDYAVDLKNFHETTHHVAVAPLLIATRARSSHVTIATTARNDGVLMPIDTSIDQLPTVVRKVLQFCDGERIDAALWETGRYHPTPTIIEAAMALYAGHGVEELSRSDATAINLSTTSTAIAQIVRASKAQSRKSLCFVTGVPGAGKTLVGLNVAAQHTNKDDALYSVFLSGNGPLVKIPFSSCGRLASPRSNCAGPSPNTYGRSRGRRSPSSSIAVAQSDSLFVIAIPRLDCPAPLLDLMQHALNILV
jgi:hypothetical protein